MAQSNYTVANQAFPATRTNINNIYAAIKSSNSGTTAPSDRSQGTLWLDTTDNMLKIRNVADNLWEDVRKMGTQNPAAISSNTTLTAANNKQIIRVDASSASVTVTLPAAADNYDIEIIRVDNATASTVTIQRAGADLINGATSITLNSQWQAVSIRGASGLWFAQHFVAYIRGTWTPVLTATGSAPTVGYSVQLGEFVKIGNLVHIEAQIALSSISGGSGTARIAGLPVTISNTLAVLGGVQVLKAANFVTAAPTAGYCEAGTTLDLTYSASATSITELPLANVGATSLLYISADYMCFN